ncbi:MAG: D-2-hydroxyacid dehydrogenase [Bacteroidales bacterium]|nr:D-2-hydroxyacid dehydrogenase [Bacteroidales bacterium]MCM1206382.1 D-2-hydroxyacid dehydrogenase [Bacillota bacterium]MCM1509116.1 D-2-hydroxyacid dehydrogenase [Clostridium sp.]
MKIVVLDGYTVNPGDISWDELREFGELVCYDRTGQDEIAERAADAEIVLTNKVVIGKKEIDALPRLEYIGVMATGYDVVDYRYAREKGITVTNVPAYSTSSVAQMVFAHLLNITNDVAHYAGENRNGRWCSAADFCYQDSPQRELSGMTIGIFGLGAIGSQVAKIADAFGMSVLAVTGKGPDALPEYVRKVAWDEMLGECDVISLNCPLVEETFEMINADTLSRMRSGSILINMSRGPLVNEQAVADALASGTLGAYCADVLSVEPPRAENPLLAAPRCYLTPHIAWATVDARCRLLHVCV